MSAHSSRLFVALLAVPCLLLSLLVSIGATESAPNPDPDPMLSLRLGDIQSSMQRFQASMYGRLLALPAFEDVHEGWARAKAAFTEETEVPADLALANLRALEFQLLGVHDLDGFAPRVVMRLLADVGEAAAALWNSLEREGEAQDAPTGADGALSIDGGEMQVARFGSLLSALFQVDAEKDGAVPYLQALGLSGSADALLTWNMARFVEMLESEVFGDDQEQEALRAFLKGQAGHGSGQITILPDGILEEIHAFGPNLHQGSQEVDLATVDRIPADALMAMAVGIDGTSLARFASDMMDQAAAAAGDDLPAEMQQIVAMLSLLEGLQGSATIALLPPPMGAPFPGLSLQLPWNQQLSEVIEPLLAMMDLALPAVGAELRPTLPLPFPMPVPLVVARSPSHLLLTTVPAHARDWLAGRHGGFAASPAWQQAWDQRPEAMTTYLLGASDTPRLITLLQNSFDSFGAFLPGDAQAIIAPVLALLAEHQGRGYIMGAVADDQARFVSKGLFGGSIMSLPILAGLTLPAITRGRGRAQSMTTLNNVKQISVALFIYSEDFNRYPQPPEGVPWPQDPRAITAASFEELALKMELPFALFRGVNDGSPLNQAPRSDVAEIWRNPNLDWAHSFAFDWNAPLASPSVRAVLASRYPTPEGQAAVAFGDHSASLLPVSAWNEDGSIKEVLNPKLQEPDNIYAGDDQPHWQPGARGPRREAWVR
ncbi:MAG: hypothetical protein EA402_14695 [Planctomycetota bacterium]|nr:MAG: hypothetical protein EA402_14695 [Planctomycetota bacterium]